jgi:hypothetical protein
MIERAASPKLLSFLTLGWIGQDQAKSFQFDNWLTKLKKYGRLDFHLTIKIFHVNNISFSQLSCCFFVSSCFYGLKTHIKQVVTGLKNIFKGLKNIFKGFKKHI